MPPHPSALDSSHTTSTALQASLHPIPPKHIPPTCLSKAKPPWSPAAERTSALRSLARSQTKASTETVRFRDELVKAHPNIKVSIHAGDLTTGAAVSKLFEDAVAEHGQLNIVINTVGMVLKKPMTDVSEAEYDTMFA
jgi:hypothetical protein